MPQASYIDVILPLALRGTFTYSVSAEQLDSINVGARVVVNFGAKRKYAAIVFRKDVTPSKHTKPKPIEYILDEIPVVTNDQLQLWAWISDYYMAHLGEVAFSALPQSLRISSQTMVYLNLDESELDELNPTEHMVLANLRERERVELAELENLEGKAPIHRAISSLINRGLISISEEVKEGVKPKTFDEVLLTEEFSEESAISALFNDLVNAPKQLEVLMRFVELSKCLTDHPQIVDRQRLQREAGAAKPVIDALIKKGVFQLRERLVGASDDNEVNEIRLSDEQQEVVDRIHSEQQLVHLLHGVTGSGKTLVYIDLIQKAISAGKQVLYLVPEIALSTQLVARIRQMVACEVLVYHSRFSQRDRLTIWQRMISDSENCKLIVGARSAVFLPFKNLGLIVVDEEHEGSYKQHEVSPNYHARDVAIWLAHYFKAKVLLGSATPSVESYFNAEKKKYQLHHLKKRFSDVDLPSVEVADLRIALKEKKMKAQFTPQLFSELEDILRSRKQAILFQNRRGFAPFVICESCGWNAECINCDVGLTYHKRFEKLVCHYCGYNYRQPSHCPECGSAKIQVKGTGTEKIEDDLEILFPEARIGRMDWDTTRTKHSFENLIQAFSDGSLDILVGTQMITKGLDFDNVALVGVLNADALWNRPDFRSYERAYQLLTQVSGRAGRKGKGGKVIIQTYNPDHPILSHVKSTNYMAMYQSQLLERHEFDYPPYTRMVRIELGHKDAKLTRQCAEYLGQTLREQLGKRVLGPEEPPIARVRNRFLRTLFVKIESAASPQKIRLHIRKCIDLVEAEKQYRSVRIKVDVDPI